ncbi:Uncharacterised protein [Legionella feeleii]|uniref:Uncharacterized protein n=1 Tax=Legionella feeleii TaxID=453 RepID=A0A378IYE2_9GAMM|nr:Uncharacterised protein [Legionella feeleii]
MAVALKVNANLAAKTITESLFHNAVLILVFIVKFSWFL